MTTALRLLVLACCLLTAAAETFANPKTVGPGTNPTATLADGAKVGDVITVTFTAQSDYTLASSNVDDPAKLGWIKNGNTFTLTVSAALAVNVFHSAKFSGTLTPITPGPGSGVITWDMSGRFKVLGAHQGVGDDLGRSPPAGLTTSKPGVGPTPTGEATYNKASGQFDGSFSENGQKFLGQYVSIPAVPDVATATPVQLGSAEDKPCPEGDGVTVKFVYFGCATAGGIGGKAVPDDIQINDYKPAETAAAARAIAEATAAGRTAAAAALAAAQAAMDAAQAAVTQAEAALAAATTNNPAVKAAEARLAAAQAELARVTAIKATVDAAWAAAQAAVKAGTLSVNSATYRDAQRNAQLGVGELARAQAAVDRETAAVARARANAANSPAVKAAQQALDAAKATLVAKTAARDAAKTADDVAAANLAAAEAHAAELEAIEAAWAQVKAGTLVHEQGHRRICYFFADQITTMLNQLRAWGYSPTETTAATIGAAQFRVAWAREVKKIQDADRAMQDAYDGPGGSNHGVDQGNWDWNRLR